MGVVPRRSITDSPFYVASRNGGENVARLASGVQEIWSNGHGQAGKDAGFRLVQAGFHYRTALMGIRRAEAPGTESGEKLKAILGEREDQLLAFSGAKEAITAFASTLDLAAAAIFRLYYGPRSQHDPNLEHDLKSFPSDSILPSPLPPDVRDWLRQTEGANELRRLKKVRDMFTHQYFPRHVTIGAFDHQLDLDGKRERLEEVVLQFSEFVIDRLVALSIMYAPR